MNYKRNKHVISNLLDNVAYDTCSIVKSIGENDRTHRPDELKVILFSEESCSLNKHLGVYINLHAAVALNYFKLVNILLEDGCYVNSIDENGLSPLHYAVVIGSKTMLKLLIKYSANVDIESLNSKHTPLHYAVFYEDIWITRFLLMKGANIYKKDTNLYTPIYYAMLSKNKAIIDILIRYRNYTSNKYNHLDLHYAIKSCNLYETKRLIDIGVDDTVKDSRGMNPLHYAVRYSTVDIVKALLDGGVDVNATDKHKRTPLHHAVKLFRTDVINLLMEYNADASIRDSKGITPFSYAMYMGYYSINREMIDIIIKYHSVNGATRDIDNVFSRIKNSVKKGCIFISLHDAARLGYIEVLQHLIANGEDINVKDEYCYSALHHAVKSDMLDTVNFLIRKGIDVNLKDINNRTALYYAVKLENTEIVSSILERSAELCSTETFDHTPITVALQDIDDKYYYHDLLHWYNMEDDQHTKKVVIANMLISYLVANETTKGNVKTYSDLWDKLGNKRAARLLATKCFNELERMKTVFINGYSVYDIYINKSKLDINILAKRIKISSINGSISEKFPIYNEILEKRFYDILSRPALINDALLYMDMIIGTTNWLYLPLEVKYMILEYLSNKELNSVIQKE